jgi:hypothetical protein
MQNYYRLAVVMSVALVFLAVGGCTSNIEIRNPPDEHKYLLEGPYDLEVVHTGCGGVVPDSLEAQFDGKDITDAFTYGADTWTAADYELPLGTYTFSAKAEVTYAGPWCNKGRTWDAHTFNVCERACISGTVFAYAQEDPSTRELWPGAKVEVFISATGRQIGEGVSDESGHFCFDNVPGDTVHLNIVVPEQAGPLYDRCRGEAEGVQAGHRGTCDEGKCATHDVEAHCYER